MGICPLFSTKIKKYQELVSMNRQNQAYLSFIILISVFSASSIGFTEDKKKPWNNQAELSFVSTSGNSDTENLSIKNKFEFQSSEKIKLVWKVSALRGEADGVSSSESYATSLRGDYKYSEPIFIFLDTGWEQDKFAGTKSKINVGPGVGYKLLTGPKHTLTTEAGGNYVTEKNTDGTDNSYANGRLFSEYGYQFNKDSKFAQTLEYLHDFDNSSNYNANSETSVTTAFTDIFSIKIGYTVKYDNEPLSSAFTKTDTVLSTSILANF
jgi:putative salt-induced outer membrane protein